MVLCSRVTAWLEKLEAAKALLLMKIQSSSHPPHLKSALIPQLPCEGPGAKAMSLCMCSGQLIFMMHLTGKISTKLCSNSTFIP